MTYRFEIDKLAFAAVVQKYKRAALQHEHISAAFVLLGFLLFFFSWPLINFRDHYFSGADWAQVYSLVNVQPGYVQSNEMAGDTALDLQPWLMFNRDSLHKGQIPIWNPFNANGMPYLANYQSAVFSLFSLPYYILSFRQALVFSAFIALLLHGFFTFAFLKRIGLNQLAALIGAIAFMFSGYNMVWLEWLPLIGAGVALPSGLFFVEVIFHRFESGVRLPTWKKVLPATGLTAGLVTGLLAGHPETFIAGLLLVAAYSTFRLACLLKMKGIAWQHTWGVVRVAMQICLCGILAAGIAAVQLIPFLEYVLNSSLIVERRHVAFLAWDLLPRLFFPDMLGNPTSPFRIHLALPFDPYHEAIGFYIGSLILLLAILSIIFVNRDRFVRFFFAVAVIWFAYAFNVLGVGRVIASIPGLSMLPPVRTHIIWLFSLSCCAALFVNHLLGIGQTELNSAPHRVSALFTGLLGITLLSLALVGAYSLIMRFADQILQQGKIFLTYVPPRILSMSIAFVLGLVALAGLWLISNTWLKRAASGVILILVFAQGGYEFKAYNPTIEDRFFYPVTPAIQTIKQTVNNANMMVLGTDTLAGHLNMVYGLSMITSYDALWVRSQDRLFRDMFSTLDVFGHPRYTIRASPLALKLFGVEYAVSIGPWLSIDTALDELQSKSQKRYPVGEIFPGHEITQTLLATANDLNKVMVVGAAYGRVNRCTLDFRLEALPDHSLVADRRIPCDHVQESRAITLAFNPIQDSRGKQYQIILSSSSARPGNAVTVWAKSDLQYNDGVLTIAGQQSPGGLWFDYTYDKSDGFEEVVTTDKFSIFRYKGSLSRYFSVDNAIVAGTDEESWALVHAPGFDPGQTVIINGDGALLDPTTSSNSAPATAPVEVVSQQNTSVNLKVTRTNPGYVVMAMTYYPGWKAKVNGIPQPVLRANYAFSAVKVDAGESRIEFYYDPDSFRYGLAITVFSLTLGFALIVGWFIYPRRIASREHSSRD